MPPWGAATYTVRLNPVPGGNVTVSVANGDTSAVTVALTFSTTTWNTAQTVTVAGWDDTDEVNDTVSLAHVATSADTGYAGVTIAVVAPTNTDVTGAPSSLTFVVGAWNSAQTVMVNHTATVAFGRHPLKWAIDPQQLPLPTVTPVLTFVGTLTLPAARGGAGRFTYTPPGRGDRDGRDACRHAGAGPSRDDLHPDGDGHGRGHGDSDVFGGSGGRGRDSAAERDDNLYGERAAGDAGGTRRAWRAWRGGWAWKWARRWRAGRYAASAQSTRSHTPAERLGRTGRLRRPGRATPRRRGNHGLGDVRPCRRVPFNPSPSGRGLGGGFPA